MLIFLVILIIVGASAQKLTYKPFLALLPVTLAAYVLKAASVIQTRDSMGEDSSEVWMPSVIATNVALTYAIYIIFYLAGHAIGRWKRRRDRSSTQH